MFKYQVDPLVLEHPTLHVVGLTNRVGVTTRVQALKFSAEYLKTNCTITQGELNDVRGRETGIVLVFAPGTNPSEKRKFAEHLSTKINNSFYCYDYYTNPSYTEEYEEFLSDLNLIIPSLLDMLPDDHPQKQKLLSSREVFGD